MARKIIDISNARHQQERQLWLKLLDMVVQISTLCPWNYVQGEDTFAWVPQGGETIVFFQAVEEEPNQFNLVIHPSAEAYLFHLGQHSPGGSAMGAGEGSSDRKMTKGALRDHIEAQTVRLSLGPKKHLPSEMLELLDRIAVQFGTGLWPCFWNKEMGYEPALLSLEDVPFVIQCLEHFLMELKALIHHGLPVNFAKGEILMRWYHPQQDQWINSVGVREMVLGQLCYGVPDQEQSHLAQLAAAPWSERLQRVEFDFGWLEEPVEDVQGSGIYHPAVLVFTNRVEKKVVKWITCRPEQMVEQACTLLEEVIQEAGRPKTIYLSRRESSCFLGGYVEQLGIQQKYVKRLPTAEQVLRSHGAV